MAEHKTRLEVFTKIRSYIDNLKSAIRTISYTNTSTGYSGTVTVEPQETGYSTTSFNLECICPYPQTSPTMDVGLSMRSEFDHQYSVTSSNPWYYGGHLISEIYSTNKSTNTVIAGYKNQIDADYLSISVGDYLYSGTGQVTFDKLTCTKSGSYPFTYTFTSTPGSIDLQTAKRNVIGAASASDIVALAEIVSNLYSTVNELGGDLLDIDILDVESKINTIMIEESN